MNTRHRFVPVTWQRAMICYGLWLAVSLFSNSVMWGHIDGLNHPYAFYLKCSLIGIIDFANFWLATWVLFGGTERMRSFGFVFGLVFSVVILIHTGALMKLEGSRAENVATINAVGDKQAQIAREASAGAMEGAGKAAAELNQLGQVKTAKRLADKADQAVGSITKGAQESLEKTTKDLPKAHTFLPAWYLEGAMYWALMALAAILMAFGVKIAEEEGEGLVPDNLERLFGHEPTAGQGSEPPSSPAPYPIAPRPGMTFGQRLRYLVSPSTATAQHTRVEGFDRGTRQSGETPPPPPPSNP